MDSIITATELREAVMASLQRAHDERARERILASYRPRPSSKAITVRLNELHEVRSGGRQSLHAKVWKGVK